MKTRTLITIFTIALGIVSPAAADDTARKETTTSDPNYKAETENTVEPPPAVKFALRHVQNVLMSTPAATCAYLWKDDGKVPRMLAQAGAVTAWGLLVEGSSRRDSDGQLPWVVSAKKDYAAILWISPHYPDVNGLRTELKMLGKNEVHYSIEKTFAVVGVDLGVLNKDCRQPALCLADMAEAVLMALPHVVQVDWCVDTTTSPGTDKSK